MPNRNGTGPAGMGSMTGRGMGYCSGYDTPGFANRGGGYGGGYGMGFRQGRGRGGGFGRGYGMGIGGFGGYAAPVNPVSEKEYLQNALAAAENETKAMKERLEQLNSNDSTEK